MNGLELVNLYGNVYADAEGNQFRVRKITVRQALTKSWVSKIYVKRDKIEELYQRFQNFSRLGQYVKMYGYVDKLGRVVTASGEKMNGKEFREVLGINPAPYYDLTKTLKSSNVFSRGEDGFIRLMDECISLSLDEGEDIDDYTVIDMDALRHTKVDKRHIGQLLRLSQYIHKETGYFVYGHDEDIKKCVRLTMKELTRLIEVNYHHFLANVSNVEGLVKSVEDKLLGRVYRMDNDFISRGGRFPFKEKTDEALVG